jgi:co-chaperonin GroES (HSP10)
MNAIGTNLVFSPVNPSDLDPRSDDKAAEGFGIKSKKPPTEEAMRFAIVAVGKGEFNGFRGEYAPVPLSVGDIIVFPTMPNSEIREHWSTLPVVNGKKYWCGSWERFSSLTAFVIIERASEKGNS